MSETKFTPGPWSANKCPLVPGFEFAILDRNGGIDSVVIAGVTEVNADLIAAAPDLLEALEALWKAVHGYHIGYEGSKLLEVMSDARAAIEKAKGETQP